MAVKNDFMLRQFTRAGIRTCTCACTYAYGISYGNAYSQKKGMSYIP